MERKKVLYFEGAGCFQSSNKNDSIPNCRIRTAFKIKSKKAVFCELSSTMIGSKSYGVINALFRITDEIPNEDENRHAIVSPMQNFPYTKEGVLGFIRCLGGEFDDIMVVPPLGGYCTFTEKDGVKGTERYRYSEDFRFDPDLIAKRQRIDKEIYAEERRGMRPWDRRTPNYSLWVDEEDPKLLHLLRHFNGYNKHWVINAADDDWRNTMREVSLNRCRC